MSYKSRDSSVTRGLIYLGLRQKVPATKVSCNTMCSGDHMTSCYSIELCPDKLLCPPPSSEELPMYTPQPWVNNYNTNSIN